ncbi:MAG: Hsp20/alpha crystallin family protein [Candidatus Uhrbacteria bacterium]|nr:Hsp20/alpha crystallin family protein [Candidatus Uhrbacteria bacterium]
MENNLENAFKWEASEGQLAVDVLETEDAIIIRSAIAGVKPEDLDVNVTNDVVTIRGERKGGREYTDATAHFQECFWGTFSRSVVLPHHVKPDEAEANLKNGVLTLTIPKQHGEMKVKVRNEV